MYADLVSIVKLAARLLVVGKNFGYYFRRSNQQLGWMEVIYPVLLDKVFQLK